MHWREFDRALYILKLARLSREFPKMERAALNQFRIEQKRMGQIQGVGFYAKLADAHLEVLREYLEGVDQICRDVWRKQGGILTPEFVRRVIRDDVVFTAIAARCGSIQAKITLMAHRTRFRNLTPVLHHLVRGRRHLESDWFNRYEIEARELELQQKHTFSVAERMPNTVKSVSTDRRVEGNEKLEIYVGKPQKVSRVFIEDAGPMRYEADATAISYSTFPPKKLQKLLQETNHEMDYLKSNFPDWRSWDSGYGPGNDPPDYYKRIRRLEKTREQIVLALSKYRKMATRTKSAETVITLAPELGGDKLAGDAAQVQTTADRKRITRQDAEVMKRRAVVASNPDVPAHDMCAIFDRKNVLLPSKWKPAGFDSWCKAYRDDKYRKRIHVLISKDRTLS